MGDVQIKNIIGLMEKIGVGDVALSGIEAEFRKIQERTGDLTISDIKKVYVDGGISARKISELMTALEKSDFGITF